MPIKPPRRCTSAGCPYPARASGGKCSKCKQRSTAPRPSSAALGYDRAWREISTSYRREHPRCEVPECPAPSAHVDHIDNDRDNVSESNLQALCVSCHSHKTALYDGGFGRKPIEPMIVF